MEQKIGKKEIFNQIQEKLTISDKELNTIYNDVEQAFKDKGVTPSEETVLTQILIYLTPSLRSPATKHFGIFLGVEDNFGFNQITDKVKFDSIKQYQEDKNIAVETKAISIIKDENGKDKVIPLWHYVDGVKVADFKLGRPITEFDYSATSYILLEKDGKIELKNFQLRDSRRTETLKNSKNLVGKRVSFMGIDKENTINDSKYTKFVIEQEQPKDNIVKLLVKNAKNNCLNLRDIIEFYSKNAETIRNMPVFIKCSIAKVTISETRDNNSIQVVDSGYTKPFFIYLPKSLDIPKEQSNNVIFGGRIRKSETNLESPFSMNAFMFYVPEQIMIEKPKSLDKYTITEEIVEPEKSLELMKSVEEQKEDW